MRTIFTTTAGLPPTDTMIRTESGREVRSGDIVTADDPIVLAPGDGTGAHRWIEEANGRARCGACDTVRVMAGGPYARGHNFSERAWFERDPGCGIPASGISGETFIANNWSFGAPATEQERLATWDRVLP